MNPSIQPPAYRPSGHLSPARFWSLKFVPPWRDAIPLDFGALRFGALWSLVLGRLELRFQFRTSATEEFPQNVRFRSISELAIWCFSGAWCLDAWSFALRILLGNDAK